jgi:RNA-directed DNA polymerase
MRERLKGFALSLHPDKTRLIEFGRFAAANRERHQRQVARRQIPGPRDEPERPRVGYAHGNQGGAAKWLGQVVRGWFNYHAVPTNSRALSAFRFHVTDLWRRTLRRRSDKDKTTWRG